jgi:hypothetical protein
MSVFALTAVHSASNVVDLEATFADRSVDDRVPCTTLQSGASRSKLR